MKKLNWRTLIFGIGIAPEGATIDYSDVYAKKMEAILQSVPEARWNFVAVGFPFVTQTFSVLGLSPWEERSRSAMEIAAALGGQMFALISVATLAAIVIVRPGLNRLAADTGK